MRFRRLGSKGSDISVIGYGAWEAGGAMWGENPPDRQVIDAMHAAFDAGINWIDTAEIYGSGRSEELVGQALRGFDDVMVFTKVAPRPRGSGFSPKDVISASGRSLSRLKRDVIDLYQLHMPDDLIPIEDTWEAMVRLQKDGVVRFIGLSNFPEDIVKRCERIGHVDSLQLHFSMLWQENRDLLPFCDKNGIGTLCYGSLAYGLLTGVINRATRFSVDDWRSGSMGLRAYDQLFAPEKLDRNLDLVDRIRPVADRLGITLAQLSLAWVVNQPGATASIAGSRSSKHVRENVLAGDISFAADVLTELSELVAEPR